MSSVKTRLDPFLKWPGGKRAHARIILSAIRTLPRFGRYFEPFLGAGSLFFQLLPTTASLSDINEELVLTYQQVRSNVENVITYLRAMKNEKLQYYKIRASCPRSLAKKAARFIFLNRTCWNGLYRVNLRGEFNVPYAGYSGRVIHDQNLLRKASQALSSVRVFQADFESALSGARKRDLIYLDPPYVLRSSRNGFIRYNSKLFSWSDQVRLAKAFEKLNRKGSYPLLTNLDHPEVRKLYKGFKFRLLAGTSLIAADPECRGPVSELLISNF